MQYLMLRTTNSTAMHSRGASMNLALYCEAGAGMLML